MSEYSLPCVFFHRCHSSYTLCLCSFSASASPCTWARPVSRSVTRAGSSTAWSTASSLMATCPATSLSEVATTPSTPSSARPAPASMSPGLSSSTWNPRLSVSCLNQCHLACKMGGTGGHAPTFESGGHSMPPRHCSEQTCVV